VNKVSDFLVLDPPPDKKSEDRTFHCFTIPFVVAAEDCSMSEYPGDFVEISNLSLYRINKSTEKAMHISALRPTPVETDG
jgi:hypothetical protein